MVVSGNPRVLQKTSCLLPKQQSRFLLGFPSSKSEEIIWWSLSHRSWPWNGSSRWSKSPQTLRPREVKSSTKQQLSVPWPIWRWNSDSPIPSQAPFYLAPCCPCGGRCGGWHRGLPFLDCPSIRKCGCFIHWLETAWFFMTLMTVA